MPRVRRSSLAEALATALEELMMVKAFPSKLERPKNSYRRSRTT